MSVEELDLRNDFELESLDVTPDEIENEIRFSMRATIRNLDEETLSVIVGEQFDLETVTIRIAD